MSDDGAQEVPQVGAGLLPSIPAMPSVRRYELYRGRPHLLLESGLRHSLGWQDDRKAGPSFVVVWLPRFTPLKVAERFPLTEQGWASAWRALSGLAELEPARRAAAALTALDAESLRCLRRVIFTGGSGGGPLAKGHAYDLRFLGDRIMICPPGSAEAIVEVPYRDIDTVEVGGPVSKSPGEGPLETGCVRQTSVHPARSEPRGNLRMICVFSPEW